MGIQNVKPLNLAALPLLVRSPALLVAEEMAGEPEEELDHKETSTTPADATTPSCEY